MGISLSLLEGPGAIETAFVPNIIPGGGVMLEPAVMGNPFPLAVALTVDGAGTVWLLVVVACLV